MKKVSIIGFGRFGKTLYRLLQNDFDITIYSKSQKGDHITDKLSTVYESDVIFYAVPIATFEEVISSHQKYFKPHHVLIDVLSIKLHPAAVFEKYLHHTTIQALLTHPMRSE